MHIMWFKIKIPIKSIRLVRIYLRILNLLISHSTLILSLTNSQYKILSAEHIAINLGILPGFER